MILSRIKTNSTIWWDKLKTRKKTMLVERLCHAKVWKEDDHDFRYSSSKHLLLVWHTQCKIMLQWRIPQCVKISTPEHKLDREDKTLTQAYICMVGVIFTMPWVFFKILFHINFLKINLGNIISHYLGTKPQLEKNIWLGYGS